jgi:hypothetical protein
VRRAGNNSLHFDDIRRIPIVIEFPDDLFEPPPSWARRHPFGARILGLGVAFALLAPVAVLIGDRAGGEGASTPSGLEALIEDPASSAEAVAEPVESLPPVMTVAETATEPTVLAETVEPGDDVRTTVPTQAPVAPTVTVGSASPGTPAPTTIRVTTTARPATTAPTTVRPTTKAPTTTVRPTTKAPTTTVRPTTKAPTTTRATTTTTKAPATTKATLPPRLYGPAEIESMVRAAFPADPETALLIVQRESGFNPRAYNGWCCYGLFQIHWGAHRSSLSSIGITSADQLLDAASNIRAAVLVYQRSGGWGPWSTAP